MITQSWIAVDAGQTGLRLRVGSETVEIRSPGVGASAVPSLVRAVADAWAEWTSRWSRPDGIAGASIGLTGDFTADEHAELRSALFEVLEVGELRVAHDSVPAYLGAIGIRPGVITMCGTGSVTLAWSGGGGPRRFDGLGPVLGDRGGGASLGRAGLRAAARALEGVGADTTLSSMIVEEWGDVVRLASAIRDRRPEALEYMGVFARSVADAARAGDEVATSIVIAEARDAARTTQTALVATGATTVSYAGAIFREIELFRRSWINAVHEAEPSCTIVDPEGDALAGALVVATADEHELVEWGVVVTRLEERSEYC